MPDVHNDCRKVRWVDLEWRTHRGWGGMPSLAPPPQPGFVICLFYLFRRW